MRKSPDNYTGNTTTMAQPNAFYYVDKTTSSAGVSLIGFAGQA